MKRRDFFRKGAKGVAGASLLSIAGPVSARDLGRNDRSKDNWYQVATGNMGIPQRQQTVKCDVLVVGGGMAGISAAVSSARNGVKTILIQDRPVLGGNASSEMRITVNGAPQERETGIVEEILIENWVHNKQQSYPVWDHVLYNYVTRQPNLQLILNTQAVDVLLNDNVIKAVKCWGLTNETETTIYAKQFIDCSGDGLMAAMTGAEYRTGREGKDEFGESYAPDRPDGWTMGDCIMMITKDMGRPMPFKAPDYAIPFDHETAFKDKHRRIKQVKEGFWWIEVGDDFDIIGHREDIRHKLMAYFYGVWDYIKNSGNYPEAENIALDWVGSIPGRRESRRFVGDYMLTQNDILKCRHFKDAIGFGGWSLDEHNPGGVENMTEPASYFHARSAEVYEIPYGILYSKNISNLSFAGRNASLTHIALSSTRVMATCSLMGQAVGTGASICVKKEINPRELRTKYMDDLQEQLLRDDVFIPKRPAMDKRDLARTADLMVGSSTLSGDVQLLIDGVSRDRDNEVHHWETDGLPAQLQLEWKVPVNISKVEMKGDTNVHRHLMMHKNPDKYIQKKQLLDVPPELIKKLRIEVRDQGKWVEVSNIEENITRSIKTTFAQVKTSAVRITLLDTWGYENAKLFEVRCYS
ncbi:FAD-dependent oxidoreductase [Saccharicrinis fermentans]|uniref:Putative FAD-binding dehydrogenase n=1 Tax=Saccharicrinis fermentans DSM 9555 = JCM 21142 TaxID=869213 RepID=W7XVJ6_9BACT|nr:FAD-dependent oxidoreductase [Saccharicrinis fermentans]GAF02140.1 putative FAD-binding dehydrogenase [Saccharicrinis fermentans DSM 9555 = JCM 21142]